MPMNERLIWLLKQLLCPQVLVELKGIKHKYHMWKDYSKKIMNALSNGMQEQVHEIKVHNKVVATKQGVLKDFWFKPITRKFSGEEFVEEYVPK